MLYLIITALIWSFSFGLIGEYIAGQVDIYLAILIRLVLALVVFLPFIKLSKLFERDSLFTLSVGSLQVGIMYIFYFNSYLFLSATEVALFSITTPLYISLLGSWLRRRWSFRQLLHVFLVVLGAAMIKWDKIESHFWIGFMLTQAANFSFGLGQVLYKQLVVSSDEKQRFGLFYLGGIIVISLMAAFFSDFSKIPSTWNQYFAFAWLGLVASGLGYFFWNMGVKRVSYGTLAVMNNAFIPLTLLVNIVLWNEKIAFLSFFLGTITLLGGVMLETSLRQEHSNPKS